LCSGSGNDLGNSFLQRQALNAHRKSQAESEERWSNHDLNEKIKKIKEGLGRLAAQQERDRKGEKEGWGDTFEGPVDFPI
jgi:hypothetical protein